jgi:hypothetical protein
MLFKIATYLMLMGAAEDLLNRPSEYVRIDIEIVLVCLVVDLQRKSWPLVERKQHTDRHTMKYTVFHTRFFVIQLPTNNYSIQF